jgi:hypothetical protein
MSGERQCHALSNAIMLAAAPRQSGAKRDCPVGSCLRSSFVATMSSEAVIRLPRRFHNTAGHEEHRLNARLRGRLNSAPAIPLRQPLTLPRDQIVIAQECPRTSLSGACSVFVLFACPSASKLLDQLSRGLSRHPKAGPRRSGENTYIGNWPELSQPPQFTRQAADRRWPTTNTFPFAERASTI